MSRETYMKSVYDTPLYGQELKISIMNEKGETELYENVKHAKLYNSELTIIMHDENTEKVKLYKGSKINGINPEDHGFEFPESGCYLTSACVNAKSLPDNCAELETLRSFRDNYVLNMEEGQLDIKHYYKNAPKVVKKINSFTNLKSETVYKEIYNNLVKPSVQLINEERLKEAYKLYKEQSLELEKSYLN